MKISMKNRRGVGGLISLVGLVAVFGVAATAFLELNAGQADLINTTIDVNNRLIDKNNELLEFTGVDTSDGLITVKNLGSKSTTLESYLLVNEKAVVEVDYLDKKLNPGQDSAITISQQPLTGSNEIILVTKLGKQCLILVNEGDSKC